MRRRDGAQQRRFAEGLQIQVSAAPTFRFASNSEPTRSASTARLVHSVPPATFEAYSRPAHAARAGAVARRPRPDAGDIDLEHRRRIRPRDTSIDGTATITRHGVYASPDRRGLPPLELQFECRLDTANSEQCDSRTRSTTSRVCTSPRVPAIDLELNIDQTPAVHVDVLARQHECPARSSSSRPTRPSRRAAPSPSPPPRSRSRWSPSPARP